MKKFLYSFVFICILTISFCSCSSKIKSHLITSKNLQVEYMLVNKNTIPVVFENGLGGTLDWWKKVFPVISNNTTAFIYNRPGYGSSAGALTQRDGIHIVDELRILLKNRGLNPPYILVGHSIGGLYMQLFARRYPNEVCALILVDTTHPLQLTGKGSPDNWPFFARLMFNISTSNVVKDEFNNISNTGGQVLALPTVTGKPVIILSALKPMSVKSELADDSNEKRIDIARLYPDSKQIWVDSNHGIPLEKPEAVINAILEVIKNKSLTE